MPSLVKLYNEFENRGFVILAVDIEEKKNIVRKFVKKERMPFPVLMDTDGKVARSYGIRSHPDHFLIDRRGNLIGRSLGGKNWASVKVRNLIRFLVEQKQ